VKKNKLGSGKKVITFFAMISWLMIIIAFVSTRISIFSKNIYFYDQRSDKIFTGLLFLFFLLSLLSLFIYLWSKLLSKKKLSIVRNMFGTILILIMYFLFVLIYIDNVGYTSGRWILNKNNKNVAVVLGAAVWKGNIPSPTLSSRADRAIELLDEKFVGKIILTGGKAPGELPESEVAYRYVLANGVEPAKIEYETSTSSTNDQIRWLNNYSSENRSTIKEIIIVSDAYHLPRAIEISKFYNLDVKVAESTHKQEFKDKIFTKIRECIALFNFWNFAL
jgi:vancomycin permeability regulator SanA